MPFTYTVAWLIAPSKRSDAFFPAGTLNVVRYQPTPTHGRPPVLPGFHESLSAENGPVMAQSCGTRTDSHAESSKPGACAPSASPRWNAQSRKSVSRLGDDSTAKCVTDRDFSTSLEMTEGSFEMTTTSFVSPGRSVKLLSEKRAAPGAAVSQTKKAGLSVVRAATRRPSRSDVLSLTSAGSMKQSFGSAKNQVFGAAPGSSSCRKRPRRSSGVPNSDIS